MTKKTCPLGEDCDLTVAWMLGWESAKDEYKAKIAAAEGRGMTDIDWEAKIEALDASLPRRLERAAHMAERSDIWTDTERLMPATGIADLIWEAHSEILGWRALNKLRQDSRTCPLGEDCDLTVAWMAGRQSAKDEAQAMVAAALKEAAREIDCGCAHRSEVLAATGVDRWKFCGDPCAALDAREVRALIPDAGAALDRALEQAREEGRREEREACAKLAHDLQVSADQINDAYAAKRLPGVFLEPDGYEIAAAIRARAAELKEDQ